MINSGKFQKFDYYSQNIVKYNQPEPPIIDISKITKMPIAMFVGVEDPLVEPFDARWTRDQLGNVVWYHEYEKHDHSFTLAKDMSYMTKVMELVGEYNGTPKPQVPNWAEKLYLY